jgi:probable rRNA maturation factor
MPSPEGSSVRFRRVPASLRRAPIERFARTLQKEVGKGRPFDVLIAGDAELRRLNRDFRAKDYATDVLSFPAAPQPLPDGRGSDGRSKFGTEPRPSGSGAFLGDIAISLGRARAQAREFGHTIEREVQILMLHGVLHLCGHDHETDSGTMARAEKRWRAKLGLPDGLIERVRS